MAERRAGGEPWGQRVCPWVEGFPLQSSPLVRVLGWSCTVTGSKNFTPDRFTNVSFSVLNHYQSHKVRHWAVCLTLRSKSTFSWLVCMRGWVWFSLTATEILLNTEASHQAHSFRPSEAKAILAQGSLASVSLNYIHSIYAFFYSNTNCSPAPETLELSLTQFKMQSCTRNLACTHLDSPTQQVLYWP